MFYNILYRYHTSILLCPCALHPSFKVGTDGLSDASCPSRGVPPGQTPRSRPCACCTHTRKSVRTRGSYYQVHASWVDGRSALCPTTSAFWLLGLVGTEKRPGLAIIACCRASPDEDKLEQVRSSTEARDRCMFYTHAISLDALSSL